MEKRKSWFYWLRLALFGASVCSVLFAVGAVYISYRAAGNYMHPRPRPLPPEENPGQAGIPYQEITLTSSDGLHLSGWYTAPKNGALILVAHGYGARRSTRLHILFASYGYGVVSWDFRSHGASEGDTSTLGYYEQDDLQAALDYALAQPGVQHVGVYGASMGGAAAIEVAARRPEIEALVADSAYFALEDQLRAAIPQAWMRPLVRFFAEMQSGVDMDWLRPGDEIGKISPRPVFIIQGLADRLVPPDSSQRLYAAAGEPRLLWNEPGVPHVGMQNAFPEEYERRVMAFFEMYLAP